MEEIEFESIDKLEKDAIYHISFKENNDGIADFARALKTNGIKALLTIGEVGISDLSEMIGQLPVEYQKLIEEKWAARRKKLEIHWIDGENNNTSICPENSFNPLNHEQTK